MFAYLLSVLLRPHHHNSVMIVSFVFLFVFEPSKTFMTSLVMLVWSCWKKTETFRSRNYFSLLSRKSFWVDSFYAGLYANFPNCRNFSKCLRYQKYTKYTDCYRLVCFWQILFLLSWLLVLMKLWIVSGGTSHGKVRIQ